MNNQNLQFGQFNGETSFGFDSKLKDNATMTKGAAQLKKVDIHIKEDDDGNKHRNIALQFKGVEGGGAFDTITSRTPSKFVLGLNRIKYLFNAMGIDMPDVAYLLTAKQGSDDEITQAIVEKLEAYSAAGGTVADVASVNAKGEIIFNSLNAFNEVMGEDSPIAYMYADLKHIADLKYKHEANLRLIKKENEAEYNAAKQEYYSTLDEQPVVPCQINEEAIDALVEALGAQAGEDSPVFELETKRSNRKQVNSYTELA